MQNEPLEVTLKVTGILEKLGIPYFISGSLASTLYGGELDLGYLQKWAENLQVSDLLERALKEAV